VTTALTCTKSFLEMLRKISL